MHKFEHGFELDTLKGLEVSNVRLARYGTHPVFSDGSTIAMEGTYVHQIGSENCEIVQARSSRGPNELFRLPGQSVTDLAVIAPDRLKLLFSNGDALILVDDSDQYESFVITLQGRMIVV